MFTGFEESTKVETIKYGSEITFRANSSRPYYIYCDGFNSSSVCAMALGQSTWEKTINFDFEKAVFKILPFSSPSNFKYLNTVYSYLKEFAKKREYLANKTLEDRKDEISDLRQKFYDELATNIDSYEKAKNTAVSFNSGIFVLVHKSSMKYLSLLDDEQDELVYHLVDYPDEGSFFTMAPCLKMQTQRTNYLYSGDLITLINQQLHVNSNPKTWIAGDTAALEEDGPEITSLPVYSNLEKHTPLKVSLFMDIETSEDKSILKTGDVVWLNFSERPYYIEAQLPSSSLERTLSWITKQLYSRTPEGRAEVPLPSGTGQNDSSNWQNPDVLIGILMEKLLSKFNLGYRRIEAAAINNEAQSSHGSAGLGSQGPRSEGLFKIESQAMVTGERVCWMTNYYRFKHVLSGRYLAIDPESPDSNYLTLERLPTINSLLSFMPIQSGSTLETANRYVNKDSYYQLRSLAKNWLRLPLRKLEARNQEIGVRSRQPISGAGSNETSFHSGTPVSSSKQRSVRSENEYQKELDYGLAKSTDIDTLRVNIADPEDVRQKASLMSTYPTVLNALIVIGDLNSQLSHYWGQQKNPVQGQGPPQTVMYKHFELMFPKLSSCLDSLINYLLNQSPSSINKERRTRLQTFAFSVEVSTQVHSDALEAKDKLERLEEMNFFKRIKLLSKCMELIRLICYSNQQAQFQLASSLPILTRYVGLLPAATQTIREILKNNDALLMEYSKIKKVSVFEANLNSPKSNPRSPQSPPIPNSNQSSQVKGGFAHRAAQTLAREAGRQAKLPRLSAHPNLKSSGLLRQSANDTLKGAGSESPRSAVGSVDDLMKSLEENISGFREDNPESLQEKFDFKFFQTIASRMDLYPAYTQADVLSYFRFLAHTQNKGFYLNQNEIFSVIFRTKFVTDSLINTNFVAEENELSVRYHNTQGDMINQRFSELVKSKHSQHQTNFLKESLLLYSSLTLFRNDITGRYFRNHYPLHLLVKYARDDQLADEFRAVFLRLMHSLYLDREPRNQQELPCLIHYEDSHVKLTSNEKPTLNLSELKLALNDVSNIQGLPSPDSFLAQPQKLKTSQIAEAIMPRLSESKQELMLITRLREVVISTLESRSKPLFASPPHPNTFYNEFTWEMLKVLHSLIKFDCYEISDESQAELCQSNMLLIERIVKCLVFPLEFDLDYHTSLLTTSNKLRFRQNEYNSGLRKGFNNAINLNAYNSSSMMATLDPFANSPVFRKCFALSKIVSLFSNKIYQAPQRDFTHQNLNIAELVKIEICKILELLLCNRQEHILLNTLQFFRSEFRVKSSHYQRLIRESQDQFIYKLLPNHCYEAGQDKPELQRPYSFTTFNQLPIFKSFDEVIGRSFQEVLLVSFYFATTPELQGLLTKLLQKSSSQHQTLMRDIQSTLLLQNSQELDVYKKLRLSHRELESYKSVSQVWFMIIKKNLYEREYERALSSASGHLQDLYQYLKLMKEIDPPTFFLQQQILRKLQTHTILLDFIKEGYIVFETMEEIAQDYAASEQHYRVDVFDILCNFFRHCHLVIILFCEANQENQLLIAQDVKLFLSNRYINFGQIELLSGIVSKDKTSRDSSALSRTQSSAQERETDAATFKFVTADEVLDFLMDLIGFHRELPEVIRLLLQIIETGGKKAVFVKKIIMQKMLSKLRLQHFKISGNYSEEVQAEALKGFGNLGLGLGLDIDNLIKNIHSKIRYFSFDTTRNKDTYELLLVKLLAACVDSRSGITIISRTFELYEFELLIDTVNHRAVMYRDSALEVEVEELYLGYFESAVHLIHLYIIAFEKYFLKYIMSFPGAMKNLFDNLRQVVESLTPQSDSKFSSPSGFLFSLLRITQRTLAAHLKVSHPDMQGEDLASFFLRFCDKVLSHLEGRISKEVSEEDILLLKQLSKNLKVVLPPVLDGAIQDYNEKKGIIHQQQRNDILNTSMTDVVGSSYGQLRAGRTMDRGILKEQTLGRKNPGNKYKEILIASEKEELNSSKHQLLTLEKHSEMQNVTSVHDIEYGELSGADKWTYFQLFLSSSNYLKAELVREDTALTNTFVNFVMAYNDDDPNEMMIFCEDLVSKLIDLLEFWQQRRIGKPAALFLIKTLGNILRATTTPLERLRIQVMMNGFGLMRILINIFVQETESDILFLSEMIKLGGLLLEGGNRAIQDAIYKFFLRDPLTSEKFFGKITKFLQKHATFLQSLRGELEEPTLDNLYFPNQLLELLRLFCENHHTELQNYIRNQEGAKNQHDMVECVIQLLVACKVSPFTRPIVEKICETLTEFAQGPCRENQIRIATSGFLEYAASLLKRDPKLRLSASNNQEASVPLGSPVRRLNRQQSVGLSTFKKHISSGAKSFNEKTLKAGQTGPTKPADSVDTHEEDAILGIVEKLRYKCLNTTMALLEKLEPDSVVVERIRKTMPVWVLRESLIQIYQKYHQQFGEKYVDTAFRKYDSPDSQASCIIENGFFIYLLASVMIDSVKPEEEERYAKIMTLKLELESCDNEHTSKKIFAKLGASLKDTFNQAASLLNLAEDNKLATDEKKLTQQALKFFKSKIASIEIVRDGRVEKVSFPRLPYCFNLPKRTKALFTEEVDRKSITTKLIGLSESVSFFLAVMDQETRITSVANKLGILGYLLYHKIEWLIWIMYLLGVAINIILLFEYAPSNGSESDLENIGRVVYILYLLGLIDLGISSYVMVIMCIRNIPIMLKEMIQEASVSATQVMEQSTPTGKLAKFWDQTYRILRSVVNIVYKLSRDETGYYILYVASNFLGLFYEFLSFIFQLSFVVRLDLLKNVVSALWIRKTQLILTFLLLILIFYYYAIVGYQFFPEDFPLKRCDKLFDCLVVTFDLTFKDGGGIGVFLTSTWTVYSNGSRAKFFTRFFYDTTLAMILVNVMLNIVTGIIIDEFGSLKDSMNERLEDTLNTCFVCGFTRDIFERNNVDFDKHVRGDHYKWNYVYYIAYLTKKKKTDLTGTESYVMDLFRENDMSWFPVKKSRGIKDEDEEQSKRYSEISRLEGAMKGLKDEFEFVLDKTNKMYEDVLLEKR